MKKLIVTSLLIVAVGSVSAGGLGIGAGLIFSDSHLGLTVEKSLGHHKSVGLALFENSLHLDYVMHNDHLLHTDSFTIPVFYGVGGGVHSSEHHGETEYHFALRIPVGAAYYVMDHHLEGFLETVPTLTFGDDTHFDVGVSLGARYHF